MINGKVFAIVTLVAGATIFFFTSCGQKFHEETPVSVLHVSDLFRPHDDPDDHWDAAMQFALACHGEISLEGVVIDNLPNRQPDVCGISQLNWLSGLCVPVGVGKPEDYDGITSGLNLIHRTLEKAKQPVAIHVVGGCSDIARAAQLWPDLFREKVRGVYLNAGSAEDTERLEWNVSLHPDSYAEMFSLPCPLYWMPCFQSMNTFALGENGTFWKFRQERCFCRMRPEVFQYFDSMLSRCTDTGWLAQLQRPLDEEHYQLYGQQERNMWCTAGFLHTAGLTVWKDGKIKHLGENPEEEVFAFVPIKVRCTPEGHTSWEKVTSSTNRFIFQIRDLEAYQEAMTKALGEVMSWL